MKSSFLFSMIAGVVILAGCADSTVVTTAPKDQGFSRLSNQYEAPLIDFAGSTQASIKLQVCAGGVTGAPEGFVIQWLTSTAYAANGNSWTGTNVPCQSIFTGTADVVPYNLGADQCVLVDIGETLVPNGAITACPGALDCGTQFMFRVLARTSGTTMIASDYSPTLPCSTAACTPGGTTDTTTKACTSTQGYWKTHGPTPTGNNTNVWPVSSLTLGTVSYSAAQLQSIFDKTVRGNGLISLAHQLIAAKLNIKRGANGTAVASAITSADALIGSKVVPPVGTGYLSSSSVSSLVTILTQYNEGKIGPGHCNDPSSCSGH